MYHSEVKMYNTVIIGAGNIAAKFDSKDTTEILTHAHAFQNSDAFRLLGFYDKDYNVAKIAAKNWGCHAFESLESALDSAEIVSCCVPDPYHKEILEKVAKYKPKLVITEKPLTVSMTEAKAIEQIYDHQIPILLNYSRRFLKEFQNLREKIKQYGAFLKGVGYYGKGILHNGSHMIDLLRFLLESVECLEVLKPEIHDFNGDISTDVRLQIQNGQFQMIAIDSRIATIFEMELFFEKARIRILDGGTRIELYQIKESGTYQGYYNYVLSSCESVNYSNAMTGLMENAQRFLDGDQKLLCTLEDGIDVLQICTQIRGEIL